MPPRPLPAMPLQAHTRQSSTCADLARPNSSGPPPLQAANANTSMPAKDIFWSPPSPVSQVDGPMRVVCNDIAALLSLIDNCLADFASQQDLAAQTVHIPSPLRIRRKPCPRKQVPSQWTMERESDFTIPSPLKIRNKDRQTHIVRSQRTSKRQSRGCPAAQPAGPRKAERISLYGAATRDVAFRPRRSTIAASAGADVFSPPSIRFSELLDHIRPMSWMNKRLEVF
ncbi:hypothetical protein LTR85_005109 [Meristemomyces frigidus]|nr:hypothetical protein LTR85_005109 [Meristemomyces frigidus]